MVRTRVAGLDDSDVSTFSLSEQFDEMEPDLRGLLLSRCCDVVTSPCAVTSLCVATGDDVPSVVIESCGVVGERLV